MISWLAENLASLVLLLIVAAIVFFLVRSKLKKTKTGDVRLRV